MKKRTIIILIVCAGILFLAQGIWWIFWSKNEFTLTFTADIPKNVVVEYGDNYILPTVSAKYEGSIFHFFDTEVAVNTSGAVDLSTVGKYDIAYFCEHRGLVSERIMTVTVVDTVSPVITLVSDPDKFTNPNSAYEEEGYSATDNYDGDLTAQVVRKVEKDLVTYTVTDSSGNTATVTRTVVYKDVTAPVITLTGGDTVVVEAGTAFNEPGYLAMDDCEGDITERVTVTGEVDPWRVGTYTLTYSVADTFDNQTTVTRTVTVRDTTAPKLSLSGDKKIYLQVGESFQEPGFYAADNIDGDLTSSVVTKNVDVSKRGVYTISYSVKDSSGNAAYASRTLFVYEKQAEADPVDPGDKVVYLTFDDGPGKYTEQLLDILDTYGIKATFFVTNQFPKYQYLIAEEYARGHTVAIHTYTHEYDVVYKSEAAFYEDIQKMSDVIYAQTGMRPSILRFPGGSSNKVSKNYSIGIMTSLTRSVGLMGYLYCDWNVSSGDASSIGTEAIVENVISGIQSQNVACVLQHDINPRSVAAVEEIIVWGLANGYTFLPMDETTPMVHHNLNN